MFTDIANYSKKKGHERTCDSKAMDGKKERRKTQIKWKR